MRAGGTFFRLELKKYGKAIPAILLESLLFGLLILAFGAFATKYVYGGQTIGQIRVGIVSEEEESLTQMLTAFVSSMNSTQESCSFEIMEENAALEGLKEGSIYAAILIPEGMFQGIMNGRNIPATVLFSTAYSRLETEVFMELTESGSRLLKVAQAGIYAADALCMEMEHQEWIQETEDYLNRAYLQYALNRDTMFKLEEVQATGSHSLMQYYVGALLLAFLSFVGLTMGRLIENRKTALSAVMSARGFSRIGQFLMDTLAFAVVFSAFGVIFSTFFLLLAAEKSNSGVLGIPGAAGLFLVYFTMGLFIRILIEITGNHSAGLGVCLLLLLIMMTASGLFVPQAFLPAFVEKAGNYMPYRLWLDAMLRIMG